MPPALQAVAVQTRVQTREALGATDASPLALWHLLSLDAPTVAVLWTWFVAHLIRVSVPTAVYAAMFVAVWLLYAVDRLLDSCAGSAGLELRHLFHHRHRAAFAKGIGCGAAVLAVLVVRIPELLFLLYCAVGALLVVWFAVIHVFAQSRAERLPKELAVGVFFSAAVFLPGWLGAAGERPWLLLAALCFGLLCTFNCLSIYAWEHALDELDSAHPTTRFGVRVLRPFGVVTVFAALSAAAMAPAKATPLFLATALAAMLLLALGGLRRHFDRTDLRAAADLVLLTPLLLAALTR